MNRTQANGSRAKIGADKNGAPSTAKVEDAVRVILRHIGEDPDREGLDARLRESPKLTSS